MTVAGVTKAVDLCAAPGSWSQVLSKKLRDPNEVEPEKRKLRFKRNIYQIFH